MSQKGFRGVNTYDCAHGTGQLSPVIGRPRCVAPAAVQLADGHMSDVPVGGIGRRSQRVARGLLHDFASSGVDEDLELLRSAWTKPPTPPPAPPSEDEDVDEDGVLRWPGQPHRQPRPKWQSGGPSPAERRQAESSLRVRSGALDYRSSERLSTLHLLREVAEGRDPTHGQEHLLEPMALLAVNGGRGWSAPGGAARREPGMTEIERVARRTRGQGGSGLDWSTWEARWAEQLQAMAGFARQRNARAANEAESAAARHAEREAKHQEAEREAKHQEAERRRAACCAIRE